MDNNILSIDSLVDVELHILVRLSVCVGRPITYNIDRHNAYSTQLCN